jgi:hypothetical protein
LEWVKDKHTKKYGWAWRSFCYYPSLESCVNGVYERLLRLSDAEGVEGYRVERSRLISALSDALRTHFKVEVRND